MRATALVPVSLLGLSCLACGEPAEDSDASEPSFAPVWGSWTVTQHEWLEDDCDLVGEDEFVGDSFIVEIQAGDGTTFTIADYPRGAPEGEVSFPCTLDDAAFSCAQVQVVEDDLSHVGYNASVVGHAWLEGSFAGEAELEAEHHLHEECVGADCEAVVATWGFPCDLRQRVTGAAD